MRSDAVLAAASSAVQQFTGGAINPTEEFLSVLDVISLMGLTGGLGDGSQTRNEFDRQMSDITPGTLALGNVSQISKGVQNISISKDNNDGINSSNSNNNSNNNSDSSSSSSVSKILNDKVQRARWELVSMTMNVMTGIIENLVTAGGSAAYHRKALSCLEVSTYLQRDYCV